MKSLDLLALQQLENQFGIDLNGQDTSLDAIVAHLVPIVTYEMTYNLEHFFSLLYRLDISEAALKQVMNGEHDVPKKIATLIVERQIPKVIARNHFTQEKPDDELAW